MAKKKSKSALDFLVSDEMVIPTKDGKTIIARQFNPRILTCFIQMILEKTDYKDLNTRDKQDIETAVNLIYAENREHIA